MNANELADIVDQWAYSESAEYLTDAAKLLRQQAKELDEAGHMIGVLREYISDLENGLDSSIKLNKAQAERASMNNIPHIVDTGASVMRNEPVAYVNSMCNDYIDWKIDPMSIDGQSLYTHPVKELTDEEITACIDESEPDTADMIRFARAILRKAQEK